MKKIILFVEVSFYSTKEEQKGPTDWYRWKDKIHFILTPKLLFVYGCCDIIITTCVDDSNVQHERSFYR